MNCRNNKVDLKLPYNLFTNTKLHTHTSIKPKKLLEISQLWNTTDQPSQAAICVSQYGAAVGHLKDSLHHHKLM
jgi:hypothetical protein